MPMAASSLALRRCSSMSGYRGSGDVSLFKRLEPLGEQAKALVTGSRMQEFGNIGAAHVHTHSATMCWVAADRLARIVVAPRVARAGSNIGAAQADEMGRDRFSPSSMERQTPRRSWEPSGAVTRRQCSAAARSRAAPRLPTSGSSRPCDLDRQRAQSQRLHHAVHRVRMIRRCRKLRSSRASSGTLMLSGSRLGVGDARAGPLHRNSFAAQQFRPAVGGHPSDDRGAMGNLPQTYCMAGIINTGRVLSRSWDHAWSEVGT